MPEFLEVASATVHIQLRSGRTIDYTFREAITLSANIRTDAVAHGDELVDGPTYGTVTLGGLIDTTGEAAP